MTAPSCKHCQCRVACRRELCRRCVDDPSIRVRYAVPPVGPRCRYCRTNKASRARGLCFACSRKPEVRALYPLPVTRYRRRGSGLDNPAPQLAPHPTAALPGTPEKVAVMAERAAQGYSVFHPGDSWWGESPADPPPPQPHKSGAGEGVSPRCRHCRSRAVSRRGLCHPCYGTPAVRAAHALPKGKPGPKQKAA